MSEIREKTAKLLRKQKQACSWPFTTMQLFSSQFQGAHSTKAEVVEAGEEERILFCNLHNQKKGN